MALGWGRGCALERRHEAAAGLQGSPATGKTVWENGQETTAVPALAVHQPLNRESQDHQIQECQGE